MKNFPKSFSFVLIALLVGAVFGTLVYLYNYEVQVFLFGSDAPIRHLSKQEAFKWGMIAGAGVLAYIGFIKLILWERAACKKKGAFSKSY